MLSVWSVQAQRDAPRFPGRRCLRAPRRAQARAAHAKSPRTVGDLPAEAGWPVLGKAAWVVKTVGDPDPISPYFDKHASDFVNINQGPLGGWIVSTRDRETILAIINSEDFLPAWPASLLRMFGGRETARPHDVNKRWRKATGKVLRPEVVARLHVPLMARAFEGRIRGAIARGEPVLWASMTRRMAFEVATRASVGDLVSQEGIDALYREFDAFLAGSFALSFGLREGLPRTLYRRCADARARIAADLAARIGAAVTAYRAGTLESPVVRDLFEAYEEAGDDLADPEVMKTIVNTVIELMWAGTGTTAHTMGSVAQLLAAHPQWFERAQREQDRLQAAHGPALTGKVLSQSFVAQAITHEVLRISPPASAVMRKAVRDTTLPSGLHVPAGTKFSLRMRPMIEGARPRGGSDAFDPAQWLAYPAGAGPGDAAATAYRPAQHRVETSMAFGGGARQCLGNNLAVSEMIAVIAVLVRGAGGVRMAPEERERRTFAMFEHPTGMPVELVRRAGGA